MIQIYSLMTRNILFILTVGIVLLFNMSCGKINLLSLEDERQLGEQAKQEIASNPAEFPILPKSSNPQAYAFIEGVAQDILNSGQVEHRDDFNGRYILSIARMY